MNYQELVISALIPKNKFEKSVTEEVFKELAKNRINSDYFSGNYKTIFDVLTKSFSKDLVIDQDILQANISNLDQQKQTECKILFQSCREQVVGLEKLQEILPAFIQEVSTVKFSSTLLTTGKILTEGYQNGKGKLHGLVDAKKYLIENISGIKSSRDTPEGAIQDSISQFWENYNNFESNPQAGIKTGFKYVDQLTNGLRKGELITVAAYSGHGKSQILRNWFYHASVNQEKNVVYLSLELSKNQLLDQFMSLHSLHSKFGLKKAIEVTDIINGTLNDDQKRELKIVSEDWKDIKGIAYLKQFPHGSSVSTIREFLTYLNTLFPVDAVYLDYAGLLRPEYNRQTVMAEVASVYNDLKLLALDFNGEGIPIVSAWQISRSGLDNALKNKDQRYTLGALADSSYVERTSDMVFSALSTDEFKENHELKMQCLKNRRGKLIPDWMMMERFEFSKLDDISFDISKLANNQSADMAILD